MSLQSSNSAPGIRAAGGGRLQRKPETYRGILERGGDSDGTDSDRIGGHVVPFPPATEPMLTVWDDVEHGKVGEGGEVPDKLHPGDRFLSLQ